MKKLLCRPQMKNELNWNKNQELNHEQHHETAHHQNAYVYFSGFWCCIFLA